MASRGLAGFGGDSAADDTMLGGPARREAATTPKSSVGRSRAPPLPACGAKAVTHPQGSSWPGLSHGCPVYFSAGVKKIERNLRIPADSEVEMNPFPMPRLAKPFVESWGANPSPLRGGGGLQLANADVEGARPSSMVCWKQKGLTPPVAP